MKLIKFSLFFILIFVVNQGCMQSNKDTVNSGELIIAPDWIQESLAECLDHHIKYARKTGVFNDSKYIFAVARCNNEAQMYSSDSIIKSFNNWKDPTKIQLRECKKFAETYLREYYPKLYTDYEIKTFYALSVCVAMN